MSCLVGRGRRRRSECTEIPLAKDELDCMSPLAALQQQFEQKHQKHQWHRRLSPLKRKSSSSLLGGRATNSSSSASPQRRPPSPEKRQQHQQRQKVPMYQELMGHGRTAAESSISTKFQEAWEHLNHQQQQRHNCNGVATTIGGEEQNGLEETTTGRPRPLPLISTSTSLPPTPIKHSSNNSSNKMSQIFPQPSRPSNSAGSPLEMPDSINPVGRAIVTPICNGQNGETAAHNGPVAGGNSSSAEASMCSSILASPAWYRDREGRTGFRPDDFPRDARVQSSPIKVIPQSQSRHQQQQQQQQPHQLTNSNGSAKGIGHSMENGNANGTGHSNENANGSSNRNANRNANGNANGNPMNADGSSQNVSQNGSQNSNQNGTQNAMPSSSHQQQHYWPSHLANPRPIRHTSTLPLPSSASSTNHSLKHTATNSKFFGGLPPIAPPPTAANESAGGPFPLRRTQNTGELSATERARREWRMHMNGNGPSATGSTTMNGHHHVQQQSMLVQQAEQLMRTSSQSQKVVTFAETVQVNEIAPRDEMEGSLCSTNSSASSSNSSTASSSPASSNASPSDEEKRIILSPISRSKSPPKYAECQISPPSRNCSASATTSPPPPLAVVRPRQITVNGNIESQMDDGGKRQLKKGEIPPQNGEFENICGDNGKRQQSQENGHKSKRQPKASSSSHHHRHHHQHQNQNQPSSRPNTADLERVIEQFFRHCHSLSSLQPSEIQQQHQQQQEQQKQQKEEQPKQQQQHQQQQQQLSPQSSSKETPLQQRSVYDNLAEEEPPKTVSPIDSNNNNSRHKSATISGSAGADWLHTKAKVVAQQNSGPVDWHQVNRDGSPTRRRRVEVLVTSSSHNMAALKNMNGNGAGNSSYSYATQTMPITGPASRKSNSVESHSRIPLPRPSATVRPSANGTGAGGGHHSGSESSSSSTSTSLAASLGRTTQRHNNSTMTSAAAAGATRPFAVVRSRSKF